MKLLVGLGNPAPKFARNRHNIGYVAVDTVVRRPEFGPWRTRFEGMVSDGTLAGEKVAAFKPTTYMNDSGRAVAEAMRFYKLAPSDVIVIHDEVDLVPGKLRVKRGGGSAGHNGLRSLDAYLGADYWRVRLGVGHPGDKDLVPRYVLHDFAKADAAWVGPLIDAVADNIGLVVAGKEADFMNRVALILNPPVHKPKPEPTKD
jgi:peptidyl-tRNA hydrolase, PTH1 family